MLHLDGETLICDLLDRLEGSEEVLREQGLSCRYCPSARGETLREACDIHGVDVRMLLSRLRELL